MAEIKLKSYQELIAWQKAMDLAVSIYKATDSMPRSEQYGLTAQVRAAAISVPSNLAEGFGRQRTPESIQHARIGLGSLFEAETQIILAHRLGFISEVDGLLGDSAEVSKIIYGLVKSLERRRAANH